MPVLKILKVPGLLILFIFGLIISCKKEDTTDFVKQAEIAAHYVIAEDNMADLFVLFHKALHDTTLINNGQSTIDSALVGYVQNSGPAFAEFIFDFGDDGKNCPDGKFRKGQITAVLSNSFDQPEAVFTANFGNYMVDSLKIIGTFSYKNTGQVEGGQYKFEIGFNVSFYSQFVKVLTISAQRNLYWKSGYDKPYNTINHVFRMPGGAIAQYFGYDGSMIPLVNISATFTQEWIIRFVCFNPISQGSFEVSLDDSQKVIILTGEFVDVYEDNCSGKIFFKNPDNTFGYPLYL